ncbi:hypothetical protein C6P46_003984 [Rhodotorula mucilaginosa]|uniref:Uncharacterized protein n=1 Tax=Rhodotorula mucilaginosa TaxID=5537 RepID=A0A9P6W3C9_RHOMI|nr:hypothetical protein C6P46_003984 [Rhodotorula mucilaginosa]
MPDASVVRNRSRRSAFADGDSSSPPDESHYAASPQPTLRHASTASSSPPRSMTRPTGSCSRTPTRDSPMLRSPSRCSVANPAQPSVAISRTEPDFSFKTQPSSHQRSARPTNQSAPRGKLAVKLIEARSLSAPSRASRPYVVVTFDQNEFVSREPIDELAGDAVGVAKPRPADAPAAGEPTRVPPPATPSGTTAPETETMAVPIVATPNTSSSSDGSGQGVAMPPGAAKSPSSALGRSLEEYRNGALSAGTAREPPSSTPAPPQQSESQHESASKPVPTTTTERAERPTLRPVDTNHTGGGWQASDDPTTPTSAPKNGGMLGAPDDSMAYNPTWKHEVTFDVMNDKSVLQVQIYDRSIEEEVFLGFCEMRPRLVNRHTIDQWFPLAARPGEDHEVTGEIRIQISYEKYDVKKGLKPNDFDFLRMIGKGTFGRVFQVRKRDTKRIYAMKVLSKREIVAKKEVAHTIGERKILQRSSDSPFLLGLKFSFQTETDLYLVMDFKGGGELFHHLQKEGRFTEDRARFYTAEIVLAFEHLHKFDIVYRDLKPENILLDATGHIVLCDFGLSKPDLPSDALTNTFCGTTEYLAPEVLLDDNGYSKIVDFWSLGVLLFEMCCGWSPFYAEDTQQMYKLICFGKVKFPRGVIGEDGKQFVKGLLNRNPKHRLGAQRDAAELKEHPFFKSIDWDLLAQRAVPPPFKPYVDSDESVANFDPEFTEANLFDEAPHDIHWNDSDPSADWLDRASEMGRRQAEHDSGSTPLDIQQRSSSRPPVQPLTNSVQEHFRGFTFSGETESMILRAAQHGGGSDDEKAAGANKGDDEWEDES